MSAREGYRDTLIAPAEDCDDVAEVPSPRGDKPTVATIQYEMLHGSPYELTQEDILFGTWRRQQGLPAEADTAGRRDEFFSSPRACLRSSPLGKKYGWAIHFDSDGRAALLKPGTAEFTKLVDDEKTKVLHAMRSSRAKGR